MRIMRSTSAILYQQVPVQIRQTSIRDPTLPSAIFIFRIDIIATKINIKCYIDSRPALCRQEIAASINHAKKFSLKSLTISDYHFINPIKNPTKKNRKSKKSNEHI